MYRYELSTVYVDTDETETNTENNSRQLDMTLSDFDVSTAYILETQTDADTNTEIHLPMLEVTVINDSYVAAKGSVIVKNQSGDAIFTSQIDEIDEKDKKVYKVDITEYLPTDGTAVLLTTEFVTDANEYYKSNNSDDKSVYRIENTQTEIEDISKGINVTELKKSGYEYTGSAVKPTMFVYNNGELLKEGEDYTLRYENNINVYNYNESDDGFDQDSSPKVVVSFQDNVVIDGETVNEVSRYFKIISKDINGNDVVYTNTESYENGSIQYPDITISVNGTLLVKDTDYTITYPDEGEDAYKVEGMYNVLIKGIGNYSGAKYAVFTIHHKHSYNNYYNRDGEGHWRVCVCGEISKKESHIYGDWVITKDATDIESGIKERACSICGYKDATIIAIKNENGEEKPSEDESCSEEKSSEVESDGKEKPSEIESSSEENSSENESSSEEESSENESNSEEPSENESVWGDIIVEDRPITTDNIPKGLWLAGVDKLGYTYTGEAIKPEIRVYDYKKILTEKSDYTTAYKNNINVGQATITVTSKGNYSGKETATFNILPADILGDDFYSEDFYVKISQKAQSPIPELYYMGTKLKYKKDFAVKYSNTSGIYSKAGEHTVIVTRIGNYTGTKELKLTAVEKIVKKPSISITKASLIGFEKSFPYTGEVCKQECTLFIQTAEGEKQLAEGIDYTVRYTNNKKAGTATVLYSGKNGYTGKLKKTFKIMPYDISRDYESKINYEKFFECVYTKGGSKPNPVITFNGKSMTKGVDYTLSYKNNKEVFGKQTPCIVVNGKGSFKGKLTIFFTINPQDLSKMTLVSCDKVYKNKAGNYKIVPKLMDLDGKLLSAGKDFDKNSIIYAYENAVTLENGVSKEAGDAVEDTDIIPVGTQIRITLSCGNSGNYTGTFTGIYRIVKADIKSAKVTIPNQTYTGKEIFLDKSQISVMHSGVALKPEDYDIIQYMDNIKKGRASVTIKGNGNYGGTKTVKFNIGAKKFLWW